MPTKSHLTFHPCRSRVRAFTLIEVLVSMVILSVIMLVITAVINQTQRTWKTATSKLSQFKEARQAFDTVARNLRQAKISARAEYWPYTDTITQMRADPVRRAKMGIRFDTAAAVISGGGGGVAQYPGSAVLFQAPLGLTDPDGTNVVKGSAGDLRPLKNLMCARGYFVQFGTDQSFLPSGLADANRLLPRFRYRLIEFRQPTEYNDVFVPSVTKEWTNISPANDGPFLRVVATNVVAMILAPAFNEASIGESADRLGEKPFAPLYKFNSYDGGRMESTQIETLHRLPTSVRVAMVAVDEESAVRLTLGEKSPDFLGKSGAAFTNAINFDQDLAIMRKYLASQRANFRIFSSNVYLLSNDL